MSWRKCWFLGSGLSSHTHSEHKGKGPLPRAHSRLDTWGHSTKSHRKGVSSGLVSPSYLLVHLSSLRVLNHRTEAAWIKPGSCWWAQRWAEVSTGISPTACRRSPPSWQKPVRNLMNLQRRTWLCGQPGTVHHHHPASVFVSKPGIWSVSGWKRGKKNASNRKRSIQEPNKAEEWTLIDRLFLFLWIYFP